MTDATSGRALLTQGLIHLLDVTPGQEAGHFVGRRKPGGVGRVFGGQVVGQALAAAAKTVAEDRPCHSLHCYFMRPASEDYEIDYHVEADMDGRAFSNRRIVARQQGKAIFNMIASFHREEAGPSHAVAMPDVPPPDSLRSMRELLQVLDQLPAGPALRRMVTQPSPIEFRPVGTVQQGVIDRSDKPQVQCWIRVGGEPLPLAQGMQRVILGFVSDLLLLATAYRPHGLEIGGTDVISASVDHSIWFHDDVECGEWLLYAMDSPFAGSGRGFARGHFFTASGRLVASTAQEGLIRLPV